MSDKSKLEVVARILDDNRIVLDSTRLKLIRDVIKENTVKADNN